MTQLDERRLRRILVQANRSVREGRPPLPEHTNVAMREYVAATGPSRAQVHMYQIWFRTRGCTYDRAGQCSMCNYGIGPDVDPQRIARSLELRLGKVPEGASIYLSPSGSLLDDLEVTPDLRERLLSLVAARRPSMFAFESRPEVFTPEKLAQVRQALPSATLIGQVGVESWDPTVRSLCHLKPTPQRSYLEAGTMMQEAGFAGITNITLGGLGLSQREAYLDALDSVRGARAAGFTTQMVFPLSAKSGTLLGWAADRGLWEPPSLWTLVRVLAEASSDSEVATGRSDLSISWFDPELTDVVRIRPDGCDRCREFLLDVLQEFRREPLAATLQATSSWRGCDCRQHAEHSLAPEPGGRDFRARLVEIAELWQAENPTAGRRTELPVLPAAG